MTGPRMDPTISLGNILVVATLIGSGLMAYAVTSERQKTNTTQLAQVQTDYRGLEARVRTLENIISAQTGQLASINDSLRELRVDVKALLEDGR